MLPVFVVGRAPAVAFGLTSAAWIGLEQLAWYTRRPGPQAQRRDRHSGAILMMCIWSGIFLAVVLAFRLPQFAIVTDRTGVFVVGIFLMLTGVALRWYAIHVLGRFFTMAVAIQPGQTVVQTGPYRWIRHPSYSGALLTLCGLALAFGNWLAMLCVMLPAVAGYAYRMRVEEQALQQALGEPYRAYVKRTKRIVPFVI